MSHVIDPSDRHRRSRVEGPRKPKGLTLRPSDVTSEPIPVTEAEDFLRATDTQAALLQAMIQSVRTEAERLSHRLLTRRSVEAEWEEFYSKVDLPRPPIDSVSSVETYDAGNDQWDSVDSADYDLRGRTLTLESDVHGVPLRVTYTAGYDDLPADLRLQMLRDIRHAYDHRDETMGEVVQDRDVYRQYRPY